MTTLKCVVAAVISTSMNFGLEKPRTAPYCLLGYAWCGHLVTSIEHQIQVVVGRFTEGKPKCPAPPVDPTGMSVSCSGCLFFFSDGAEN
eukprot:764151-Hanusia_phi.AAC.9